MVQIIIVRLYGRALMAFIMLVFLVEEGQQRYTTTLLLYHYFSFRFCEGIAHQQVLSYFRKKILKC